VGRGLWVVGCGSWVVGVGDDTRGQQRSAIRTRPLYATFEPRTTVLL
jgi:hypothetical protein